MTRTVASFSVLALFALAASLQARGGPMAYNLALQIAPDLQAKAGMVDLVETMLEVAFAAEPAVRTIPEDPNGACREVIVGLDGSPGPEVLKDSLAGLPVETTKALGPDIQLVTFSEPFACQPLLARFKGRPGVRYAEANQVIGLSAAANLVEVEGGYELRFWKGEGDCPAGCIETRHWTFRFSGDGKLLGRSEEKKGGGERGGEPGFGIMPVPQGSEPRLDLESAAPARPGSP